jgi:hypothetical protein
VRNIQRDPRLRVRLRVGLRYRWVPGLATVLPDDDPLARQHRIIRWHPLRAFNAINVRVLGADLLTVHVRLLSDAESIEVGRSGQGLPGGDLLTNGGKMCSNPVDSVSAQGQA